MKERRDPEDIDNLTDAGLALAALWLLIDINQVITISICLALTMGWFLAYRETLSDEGPR
jgi:hypothetical protein